MKKIYLLLSFSVWIYSVHAIDTNHKPYFMLSIPKSGTHLLTKTLKLITNDHDLICLGEETFLMKQHYAFPPAIYVTPEEFLEHYPKSPGQCMYNHLNFSYIFHEFLDFYDDYVPIIMIRDLRDVLVSMAFFYKFPDTITTIEEKIMMLINDINPTSLVHLKSHAKEALIWKEDPNATIILFEKLIGDKGGGNNEIQKTEILKIAAALEIHLTEESQKKIANKMWGDTWTFREGQIGQWKLYFTEKHKEFFKTNMGDLLIELGYENDNNW